MQIRQVGAYPIHKGNHAVIHQNSDSATSSVHHQQRLAKPGSYQQLFATLERITYSHRLSEYEQIARYAELEDIHAMYRFVDVYV